MSDKKESDKKEPEKAETAETAEDMKEHIRETYKKLDSVQKELYKRAYRGENLEGFEDITAQPGWKAGKAARKFTGKEDD